MSLLIIVLMQDADGERIVGRAVVGGNTRGRRLVFAFLYSKRGLLQHGLTSPALGLRRWAVFPVRSGQVPSVSTPGFSIRPSLPVSRVRITFLPHVNG
jgi:hypothetical protein